MCDYSLHAAKSRPAVKGEKLITHRFMGGTGGLKSMSDAEDVAVCLMPGTELAFDTEPKHGSIFGLIEKKYPRQAVFAQKQVATQMEHHDMLEFPDGQSVLLHYLNPGCVATVIQLPAEKVEATPETINTGEAIEAPAELAEAK